MIKNNIKKLLLMFVIINLGVFTLASAADWIEQDLYPDWTGADAEVECSDAGCDAMYSYKVEPWDEGDPSGNYYHEGNTITISAYDVDEDGEYHTFDWTSEYPVKCVIVVDGVSGAYVYRYCDGGEYCGSLEDTGLYAPGDKAISHVTFCFGPPEFEIPEAPLGTIGMLLTMLGTFVLVRKIPFFNKQ